MKAFTCFLVVGIGNELINELNSLMLLQNLHLLMDGNSFLFVLLQISLILFQRHTEHSLILNLTTFQVYCLICKCEVFLESNDPPIPGMLPASQPAVAKSDTDSDDELEFPEDNIKPKGNIVLLFH